LTPARDRIEDTELAKVSQEVTERFYNLSAVGEDGQCPNRVIFDRFSRVCPLAQFRFAPEDGVIGRRLVDR
jgi:hypothetical protein